MAEKRDQAMILMQILELTIYCDDVVVKMMSKE